MRDGDFESADEKGNGVDKQCNGHREKILGGMKNDKEKCAHLSLSRWQAEGGRYISYRSCWAGGQPQKAVPTLGR
jgi:hypothetical protein